MPDTAIATEMRKLAEALAKSAPQLDFTLASLPSLEKHARKKPITSAHTRACGAYLGETIRRQAPAQMQWVSYAAAAKANLAVAKLTPGPDLDALLQAGETFWFPLSKVEKFQENGASDALGPFAAVALARLPRARADEDEAERVRRAESAARVEASMAAFRESGSAQAMVDLERTLFGNIPRRDMHETLTRLGFEARAFLPFLGMPAEGRGHKRCDYGGAAAAILAQLVALGVVPREATLAEARTFLAGPSKDARRNAAEVLAYCDLTEGSTEVFLELSASRDRHIVEGALAGLRSTTADWRMDYATPKITMAPIAPLLRKLLAPKSPHLGSALAIVHTWSWHGAQRRDLAQVAEALIPLLDHPKRITAGGAAGTLTTYLWAIAHGETPRDPTVEKRLGSRRDGFGASALAKIRALG